MLISRFSKSICARSGDCRTVARWAACSAALVCAPLTAARCAAEGDALAARVDVNRRAAQADRLGIVAGLVEQADLRSAQRQRAVGAADGRIVLDAGLLDPDRFGIALAVPPCRCRFAPGRTFQAHIGFDLLPVGDGFKDLSRSLAVEAEGLVGGNDEANRAFRAGAEFGAFVHDHADPRPGPRVVLALAHLGGVSLHAGDDDVEFFRPPARGGRRSPGRRIGEEERLRQRSSPGVSISR